LALALTHGFVRPTEDARFQFARYAIVGGVAAAVDTGTLWFLTTEFGVYYLIAGTVAFILGLATNYYLARTFVWQTRRHSAAVEFSLYATVGVIGLGLNAAVLWLGVGVAHGPVLLTKMVSIAVVFIWNFGARRKLCF
jgi:putative flippase GtrA